jgi:multimeric flavodoxin WrbA
MTTELRALALVCTLKPSPTRSSSQLLAQQILDELASQGVATELVRVADHDVRPGVSASRPRARPTGTARP